MRVGLVVPQNEPVYLPAFQNAIGVVGQLLVLLNSSAKFIGNTAGRIDTYLKTVSRKTIKV